MKILVIPSWYPSNSYPNNGSFFKEQSEAFKNNGISVDIFVLDVPYRKTKKDFDYFRLNKYVENGIDVYRKVYPIGFLRRITKKFPQIISKLAIHNFRKYLMNNKYDAIIAHSAILGGYIATEIGKAFHLPVIVIEHSSKILLDELRVYEKEILKQVITSSNRFVCVSKNLRKKIMNSYVNDINILVHPNMVNSMFNIGCKDDNIFEFLSIGNLIPLKKMDKLIDGFCKAFSEKKVNVQLKIIGDGVEYIKLEERIHEIKREQQISLLGNLPRYQVAQHLAKSHAMALISSHETFGVAYIEALASGNVLLGYKNGGANDIINESNGLIIDNYNIDTIADGLLAIYNNYDKYDIETISRTANKLYGESSFVNYYINLINEIC